MSCGSCGHCGKCWPGCTFCKTVAVIVAVLFLIAGVAAVIGAYKAHLSVDGWMFGSLNGSASLIAVIVTLFGLTKMMGKVCPCTKSGMCSMCGKDPCMCK